MINKPGLTLCTVNKRQPDGLPHNAFHAKLKDPLNESMQERTPPFYSALAQASSTPITMSGLFEKWASTHLLKKQFLK